MTLDSIWMLLQQYGWQIGIVVIIMGCIKIPTYEIRVIPYLIKKALNSFGNAINGEIIERVEALEKGFLMCSTEMRDELHDYIQRVEEEQIDRSRSRILRFNDEIMLDMLHSKEHFDEILKDIDTYEDYCETHPDYENNRAILAIKTIKEEYSYCVTHHHFLTYTKREDREQ